MGHSQAVLAVDTIVRQPQEIDLRAWDEFVLGHQLGTPFHLMAWRRSIEATFGYRPYYLMACDGPRVRGVLPLFLVKNPILGKVLISSPFAVYGGVLADSDTAKIALRREVEALSSSLGVEYVELRNAWPSQCLGFSPVSRYVTFTTEIGPDEEKILAGIPRKVRYMVRKSCKAVFSVKQEHSEVTAFERLYSMSLRRLGTPAFPRRHFVRLLEEFRGMVDIREVTREGHVVGAVLSFYFRDQVMPYYGASDPKFHADAPNNFMYYDLMRWGGANGYRVFDFGRSKRDAAGSYDFKSHWGMVERELPYEMLLVKRKKLPNFSPANPAFRLPIRAWSWLPLWLTRALGPHLVRLFP
jgi:FemAB-related protein (PEP-CTERM system-associated)